VSKFVIVAGVRMRTNPSLDLDSISRSPHLLDNAASKSKSRLSNIGSIAQRRKPTKVATILFNTEVMLALYNTLFEINYHFKPQ